MLEIPSQGVSDGFSENLKWQADSEAQFKTLKYRPSFPGTFGTIADARGHCHTFFPFDVHHGLAALKQELRTEALAQAEAVRLT